MAVFSKLTFYLVTKIDYKMTYRAVLALPNTIERIDDIDIFTDTFRLRTTPNDRAATNICTSAIKINRPPKEVFSLSYSTTNVADTRALIMDFKRN